MTNVRFRSPAPSEQEILDRVEVRPLAADERDEFRLFMTRHHYLKSDDMVGEQLRYVAEVDGQWLALLGWSAAAQQLKDREAWIGWDITQRRRRLSLVANNARFLILPGVDYPNLASRVLALCCKRLAADWQLAYGHPVLVAESFVDSQLFRGTCYKAQGWELLGSTRGSGRSRQDYYVAHDRPKQLWVRELCHGARAVLRAGRLPDALQPVEDAVIPRTTATGPQLRKLLVLCRQVPDWRKNKGKDYPLHCLLAMMVMAVLSGVVLGQRDLAAFASKLTPFQLRTLGSYRRRDGRYDYPKETTFQRVLKNVDAKALERVLVEWQIQCGAAGTDAAERAARSGKDKTTADPLPTAGMEEDDQIAIDGKTQRGSTPHVRDEQKAQLVSAQSQPSGRVLGTVGVEEKSNEIPAARDLLEQLGPLDGKLVMLDALHSCQQTLRQIHQDNGADYLMPVKGNQAGLEERAKSCLPPQDHAPQDHTPQDHTPQDHTPQDHPPVVVSPLGRERRGRTAAVAAGAVRYRRKR